MVSSMRVLVTGGGGYLGSILVRRLLEANYQVRILDNFLYGRESVEALSDNPRLDVVVGDIRDMRNLVTSLKDTDAVIHLASIVGDQAADLEPRTTIEINFMATRNLAELCQIYGIKRFLFASTCSVYGDEPQGVMKESLEPSEMPSKPRPISLYGETKLRSEEAIACLDLDFCILRLATLFGQSPRMRFDLAVNLFAARAVNNQDITVFGGQQYRPFLHVSDAADAFLMCLEKNLKGVYNVALGNWKIIDVAQIVRQHFPVDIKVSDAIADRRNYQVSFEKFLREGFAPRRSLDFAIDEIAHMLRTRIVTDYTLPKYSNYKHLFESEEVQRRVYTMGPIGSPPALSKKRPLFW